MSETIRLRDGHGQFLRTDEILQKKNELWTNGLDRSQK